MPTYHPEGDLMSDASTDQTSEQTSDDATDEAKAAAAAVEADAKAAAAEAKKTAAAEAKAAAAEAKKTAAAKRVEPVTFECFKYPQLCVWRDGHEPIQFVEGDPREVEHVTEPVRVGSYTTSDPDEIDALDNVGKGYGVKRA